MFGTEIFYVLCIAYGLLLSGKSHHRALFELIPGFVWGKLVSVAWGAVYMGALAWVAGWYISWMYNASLIKGEK